MMCAIRGVGKTLDFAIEDIQAETHRPLYLLFRPFPARSDASRIINANGRTTKKRVKFSCKRKARLAATPSFRVTR